MYFYLKVITFNNKLFLDVHSLVNRFTLLCFVLPIQPDKFIDIILRQVHYVWKMYNSPSLASSVLERVETEGAVPQPPPTTSLSCRAAFHISSWANSVLPACKKHKLLTPILVELSFKITQTSHYSLNYLTYIISCI